METTFIYGLYDPDTNELRYIGKTNNPGNRYRQHIYDSKHFIKNSHVSNWIRKLLRGGHQPRLEILQEVPSDNWEKFEKQWIQDCRNSGCKLTNITDGGDAPKITEETKRKLSEKMKGRKHSEETKKKIGLKSVGRQANLGNKHTKETKRKISESKKGKKLSKSHIEKAIEGRKGYRHSNETKKKIGMSNGVANKGKKYSWEHKQKISEGVRKFWAKKRGEL